MELNNTEGQMANHLQLHSFDDAFLLQFFAKLELSQTVDLAMTCSRFEDICLRIWHPSKFKSFDCFQRFSNEAAFKYFLSMNADHFQSVQLFSSDITVFSEATKYIRLNLLEKVRIVNDKPVCELDPANFLMRCPNLKYVRISQEIMDFYMDTIVNLKPLKFLCMHRDDKNFDNLLEKLIVRKGRNIKVLRTCMDVFPPSWLSSDIMFRCNRLELLSLDTRNIEVKPFLNVYDLAMIPTLPSLRIFRIFGEYCYMRLKRLILNCSKLQNIYFDEEHVNYVFINEVNEMRALEGIKTELKICLNSELPPNIMRMEFKQFDNFYT